MSKEQTNLGLALSDSLKSKYLEELSVDILDIALNTLNESVLENVPIIGMMYKASKAILAIRDRLFLKKIFVYLYQHHDVSLENRVNFLSQFENEQEKREFGESVLMLLDSVNHIRKAEIIGKLSRARILELISENEFSILADSVGKLFISDLEILEETANESIKSENETPDDIYLAAQRLQNAGLAYLGKSLLDRPNEVLINRYGILLKKIIED